MQTSDPTISKAETQFYTWRGYRCAYEAYAPNSTSDDSKTPLLLIHPIGVGLSRRFWDRFIAAWQNVYQDRWLYNADLLGCGESDMPRLAYTPDDWAEQLQAFIDQVIQKPVIVIIQGALFPVGIKMVQKQAPVQGLILSGPPAWGIMSKPTSENRHRLLWSGFFDTPWGGWFYRYARRQQFLKNFSIRQLFANPDQVDSQWLQMLKDGSQSLASRYAVFSFLAGFWREDYSQAIASISQPTLVVMGEKASSINRDGKGENPQDKIKNYQSVLPNGEGKIIPGRNVLPYESTNEFVSTIQPFIEKIS